VLVTSKTLDLGCILWSKGLISDADEPSYRYCMFGKSDYKLVTEESYAVRAPTNLDQFLRFLLFVGLSRHSRCQSSPTCLIALVGDPRKT
jgi:hypothetical protein